MSSSNPSIFRCKLAGFVAGRFQKKNVPFVVAPKKFNSSRSFQPPIGAVAATCWFVLPRNSHNHQSNHSQILQNNIVIQILHSKRGANQSDCQPQIDHFNIKKCVLRCKSWFKKKLRSQKSFQRLEEMKLANIYKYIYIMMMQATCVDRFRCALMA